jgi:hypothetical protein
MGMVGRLDRSNSSGCRLAPRGFLGMLDLLVGHSIQVP